MPFWKEMLMLVLFFFYKYSLGLVMVLKLFSVDSIQVLAAAVLTTTL